MISVGKMSNLEPPPLPSRRPPRRPSAGNIGRPLPPTPKNNYENHELPHLKKVETAPAGLSGNGQCNPPQPPPSRSKSVKTANSNVSVSKRNNDIPPELPPSRSRTVKITNRQSQSLDETSAHKVDDSPPDLPPPRPGSSRRPLPSLPRDARPVDEDTTDTDDLEDRFRFHSINDLTPPEEFEDTKKTYASHRVRRSCQRRSSSPE